MKTKTTKELFIRSADNYEDLKFIETIMQQFNDFMYRKNPDRNEMKAFDKKIEKLYEKILILERKQERSFSKYGKLFAEYSSEHYEMRKRISDAGEYIDLKFSQMIDRINQLEDKIK
jgi:hypothetical protein